MCGGANRVCGVRCGLVVPGMLVAKLAGLAAETRWVVLLLGLTIAIQVQGAVYGGILTGCHRWRYSGRGLSTFSCVLDCWLCSGDSIWGEINWLARKMLMSEVLARSFSVDGGPSLS